MACTYNYETGEIKLDFHLVAYEELCELRGMKGKAGNGECHRCPLYGGTYTYTDVNHVDWKSFVKCKHQDAKDSDGSLPAKWEISENLREEALTHFYD